MCSTSFARKHLDPLGAYRHHANRDRNEFQRLYRSNKAMMVTHLDRLERALNDQDATICRIGLGEEQGLAERLEQALSSPLPDDAGAMALLSQVGTPVAVNPKRYLEASAHQRTIALFPERNPSAVMRLDSDGGRVIAHESIFEPGYIRGITGEAAKPARTADGPLRTSLQG